MTEDTNKHLAKIEGVIGKAKEILGRHGYPDNLRTVIVAGTIDQMAEHHEAMLLLIRSGKIGSAFALARDIFESMYRGLWINFCASTAQIQKFEVDDQLPRNMTEMAQDIDQQYHAHGFFEDLKNRGWKALCSYTHTGMLQLGRRFTGHDVKPSYSDGEIVEVTTAVTTCFLLLAGKFLAVEKYDQECKEVEALIGTYGPAVAAATK
jgi:hypothetical protein